jgi:hypothetical protein
VARIRPRAAAHTLPTGGKWNEEAGMAHKSGSLRDEIVAQLASSKLIQRFGVDFNTETWLWEIRFSNLSKDEFLELFLAGMDSLSSRMANNWKMVNTSGAGLRALKFENLSDIEARELSCTVAARFHPSGK